MSIALEIYSMRIMLNCGSTNNIQVENKIKITYAYNSDCIVRSQKTK